MIWLGYQRAFPKAIGVVFERDGKWKAGYDEIGIWLPRTIGWYDTREAAERAVEEHFGDDTYPDVDLRAKWREVVMESFDWSKFDSKKR